jgi:hypothetical protein
MSNFTMFATWARVAKIRKSCKCAFNEFIVTSECGCVQTAKSYRPVKANSLIHDWFATEPCRTAAFMTVRVVAGNIRPTGLALLQFYLWPNCFIHLHCSIYRMSQEECARLREGVPYVKVHRYNPKHLCPKLNGYGDNGQRKVWSSGGSTHCTCQLTLLSMSVFECGVIRRQFSRR